VLFRVLAGSAAAACVTAGVIVAVSDTNDQAAPEPNRPPIDARAFLLASARTAERAPAESGEFWYQRQRFTQRITQYLVKPGAPPAKSDRLAAKKGLKDMVQLSSPGSFTSTQESWIGRGSRGRTIIGIDVQVSLSAADKATWKSHGSPPLQPGIPMKPKMTDYNIPLRFQIGSRQVTMAELAGLPTDAGKLEAELRRRYQADLDREKGEYKAAGLQPPTFTDVLWGTAQDMLAGPITPGTRAALYRVLAKRPEIKLIGAAIDPFGRHGVALALTRKSRSAGKGAQPRFGKSQERLIIDAKSAQLLGAATYELDANGRTANPPLSTVANQDMGWTGKITGRP
jgi:hypothetical protein